MTTTQTAGERIVEEATSWPGVNAEWGERGALSLRLGPREIGHLHGDHALHAAFPSRSGTSFTTPGASITTRSFRASPATERAASRTRPTSRTRSRSCASTTSARWPSAACPAKWATEPTPTPAPRTAAPAGRAAAGRPGLRGRGGQRREQVVAREVPLRVLTDDQLSAYTGHRDLSTLFGGHAIDYYTGAVDIRELARQIEYKVAPEPLIAVQGLANTIASEPEEERLLDPGSARRWMIESGLTTRSVEVGEPELAGLVEAREVLRDLIEVNLTGKRPGTSPPVSVRSPARTRSSWRPPPVATSTSISSRPRRSTS